MNGHPPIHRPCRGQITSLGEPPDPIMFISLAQRKGTKEDCYPQGPLHRGMQLTTREDPLRQGFSKIGYCLPPSHLGQSSELVGSRFGVGSQSLCPYGVNLDVYYMSPIGKNRGHNAKMLCDIWPNRVKVISLWPNNDIL